MVYSVAIAGASGYVGGELMRVISQHPLLELKTVTANSNVGETVRSLHPHLTQYSDLVFSPTDANTLAGHQVIFLALPHAKSAEVAGWLPDDSLVLDCGADFRLEQASDWEKYYGGKHAGAWVYGLPELAVGQRVGLALTVASAIRLTKLARIFLLLIGQVFRAANHIGHPVARFLPGRWRR